MKFFNDHKPSRLPTIEVEKPFSWKEAGYQVIDRVCWFAAGFLFALLSGGV